MRKRPKGKCRSGCPATPTRQRRSRFAFRLRCRYRTAFAGIRPLAVVRVLQSRVADLVPQGTNPGRDCPWTAKNHTSWTRPGASVPWPAWPSQAEGDTTCPWPLHWLFAEFSCLASVGTSEPVLPSDSLQKTGADQACQGEVGRTSTVMEKLTGIRPFRGGP